MKRAGRSVKVAEFLVSWITFFLLASILFIPVARGQLEKRYLAYGDSITAGFNANHGDDDEGGYVPILESLLTEQIVASEVLNFGTGGETTSDGLLRMPLVLGAGGDMILVMFGTNDINRGVSISSALYNLGQMLNLAQGAGIPPMISTIIPRNNHPADPDNTLTQQLNNGIIILSQRPGVAFCDNWTAFFSYPNYWDALYSDHLHPNELGYQVMASTWFDAIADMSPPPIVFGISPTRMENGTPMPVVITGLQFLPGASPYLGQRALTAVNVVSSNRIEATVPANLPPGVYDVVVINPGGNQDRLEDVFTVINSAPVISSISPNVVEVGERVQVSIQGNYFDPTPVVWVGNMQFDHVEYRSSGLLKAVTPYDLETGVYDIRVVNPDSQEDILTSAFTVTDSSAPEVANAWPSSGADGASPHTAIMFNLRDSGTGVDLGSLVLRIGVTQVTPTVSGSPHDYLVSYQPPAAFDHGQQVNVFARVNDRLSPTPNTMVASYTFRVTPDDDADFDSLPDRWEEENSLDPDDPTGQVGAGGDPDGDTVINVMEYLGGSDPTSPLQLLTGPGPGPGNEPVVRLWDGGGYMIGGGEWRAYGAHDYGVNVAAGDIDGDGIEEVLTGPGPGRVYGPQVRGFKADGSALSQVNFFAYGTHKYGVNVTAGDIDGDDVDEIITGAGPGQVFGPHVRAFAFDGGSVSPLPGVSFFAYGTAKYGVNVACGDVDGDGIDEIITGPGPGKVFGPHIRAFKFNGGSVSPVPGVSLLAYGTHKYGVNVACGDVDGDGIDEIISGAGPGPVFGAHVRGFNCDGATASPIPWISFFAYGTPEYGVNVACGDLDGDRVDEIVTGTGPGFSFGPHVRGWNTDSGTVQPMEDLNFFAFDRYDYAYGVRVAVGHFFY